MSTSAVHAAAGGFALRTGVAVAGALVGTTLVVGPALLVSSEVVTVTVPIGLAIMVGVGLVGYVLASAGAGSGFGEFMRGFLIGVNTGFNATLGALVFGMILGTAGGIVVGVALGIVNLLAVFAPVSTSEVYQGLVGWFNWLFPMSWPVVGLGFLFLMLSLLGHAIGTWIFRSSYFRIIGGAIDWKTGTFFLVGGVIANLNYLDTAFNMGNFSYVDSRSHSMHIDHEAGHSLNLAAFGNVFHFIGAIDENMLGRGHNAYSERLAESNVPGTGLNIIPMWT